MSLIQPRLFSLACYGFLGLLFFLEEGRSGNINFDGAAASNDVYRHGNTGNISFLGIGISNRVINDV
ncbi:hypothetical protein, partial [Bathymodiolus thermophilus thioautotrophic gill symbiont]|uniref:hypothetical protein n=1 Tax=Bathymodiolus thermophilus thioautotrophic gill symbiont TaxID=2360 RepID=UPI001ED8F498